MAAGMGSRYGGLKQLDAVGPSGETIIDYSVYDAIQAGFNKVVFIIRKDFESQFKSQITDKYAGQIQVEFAFQELNALPDGFLCPEGREKPWGTGHAILAAETLIREPFVVINGDDYYGRESFNVVSNYYNNGADNFSMVAFQLDKTLSVFGSVTRGLCTVMDDGFLKTDKGKGWEFVGPGYSDPKYFGVGAGIAVRKGDRELAKLFSLAIKVIRSNGVYHMINGKYFAFDVY